MGNHHNTNLLGHSAGPAALVSVAGTILHHYPFVHYSPHNLHNIAGHSQAKEAYAGPRRSISACPGDNSQLAHGTIAAFRHQR